MHKRSYEHLWFEPTQPKARRLDTSSQPDVTARTTVFGSFDLVPLISQWLQPHELLQLLTCQSLFRGMYLRVYVPGRYWPTSIACSTAICSDTRSMIRMVTVDTRELPSTETLPPALTHLTFGRDFDQPLGVGVLPAGLLQLTFGDCFDQPLGVGVLPASLLQLTFGADSKFNRSLCVGVLPTSLEHLRVGDQFDKPLAVGVLPRSLLHLTVGTFGTFHTDVDSLLSSRPFQINRSNTHVFVMSTTTIKLM